MDDVRGRIEAAYEDRDLLREAEYVQAVEATLAALDAGELRTAEPDGAGGWTVNAWAMKAIGLYFSVAQMATLEVGPYEYHDKIPLKRGLAKAGVRLVPPGTIRYGAHVQRGAVIMPGYVNLGAFVGSGTMVDTWATVGSCAQIGAGVHLSGGVGIGGVLEPPGARPVIVEDGAFIGSRCILVEGAHIGADAVLGANVTITASTPIIDVTGDAEVVHKAFVPPRSVVVPGTRPKTFPAGEYHLSCALIIGQRKASTDKKTSLNDTLREFAVAV